MRSRAVEVTFDKAKVTSEDPRLFRIGIASNMSSACCRATSSKRGRRESNRAASSGGQLSSTGEAVTIFRRRDSEMTQEGTTHPLVVAEAGALGHLDDIANLAAFE